MKNLLPIYLLAMMMISCKASSQIITSKEEAKQKGVYSYSDTDKETSLNNTGGGSSSKKKNKKNKKSEPVAKKSNKASENEIVLDNTEYDYTTTLNPGNYLQNQIVFNALEYNGVKYKTGGTTRDGMDCSGLVFTTFKIFDISLPRSSHEQAKVGNTIKLSEVKTGDLLFFKNNPRRNVINHVGLVVSTDNGDIQFIHSTLSLGVVISSMSEDYYKRTFVQANRVIK
ncbi:C40 family peptidase [Flavobacterium beibuense]|uniref:Putative lipoprotein NlpC n=1 Tax=Flavobacterium beibuense TaxID=657326 RepID=A0A444WC43_9FLAO|nr:C40 family peptidase [Flavobacterium beibuense]RYJ43386.1 putative lipoprotein NlpC [Flavobacterium beibuense]